MDWITIITNWFADNESVLSGIAAFVAIFGLLLSPLGGNFKALLGKGKAPKNLSGEVKASKANPSLHDKTDTARKPTVYIAPFTGNSDEANKFALELEEDVRRAVTNFTGSMLVTDIALADVIAKVNVLITDSRCRATGRLQDRHTKEDFLSHRYETDIDDRLEAIDELSSQLSTGIRYGISLGIKATGDDIQAILTRMGVAQISSDKALVAGALSIAEGLLDEQANNSMFQSLYSSLLLGELKFSYSAISKEHLNKAETAARKAVSLNERSDYAHANLARTLLYGKYDFAGARRSFMRSLDVNPRYHFGEAGLGLVEIFSGDVNKGLQLCRKEVNTLVIRNGLFHEAVAAGHIKLGDYAAAIEIAEDALHKFGDVTQTLIVLAAAAGLANNTELANQSINALKQRHPEITIDKLYRLPYKDDADWELFTDGLRRAGLS